jgi:hypothetical protein
MGFPWVFPKHEMGFPRVFPKSTLGWSIYIDIYKIK